MVCDVVCMSRDITPTQSRVPVFVLARLCANTEIGVPSGEAHRNDEGGEAAMTEEKAAMMPEAGKCRDRLLKKQKIIYSVVCPCI